MEGDATRCPACQARASGVRTCPRCGTPAGGPASRFCVHCGGTLPAPGPALSAAPAAAAPAAAPAGVPAAARPALPTAGPPPSAHPAPTPRPRDDGLTPAQAGLVDSARLERQAVYQRLGRLLLAACYEGKLSFDRLPAELARQAQSGIVTIRKGHSTLAAGGICPRCLGPTLSGSPPTCRRCRLVVRADNPNSRVPNGKPTV